MAFLLLLLVNIFILKWTDLSSQQKKTQRQCSAPGVKPNSKETLSKMKRNVAIAPSPHSQKLSPVAMENCQWLTQTIRSLLAYCKCNDTLLHIARNQIDEVFNAPENDFGKYLSEFTLSTIDLQNIEGFHLDSFCYESLASTELNDLNSSECNNAVPFSISCNVSWTECCKLELSASVLLADFKPDLLVSLPVALECILSNVNGRVFSAFDSESGMLSLWMEDVEFNVSVKSSIGYRAKLKSTEKLHKFVESKISQIVSNALEQGISFDLMGIF